MKAVQLASFGIIPAALLITACGDDVTKVTKIEETSGMEVVASADSLGKCTAELSGEMRFATKENAVYVCADSVWKNVSAAEKAACSAEILADSSGFKIVCDGDSIGVVLNGTDGKDGEKGKAGDDCEISDGGDGTVSVVCGDASTTLYKAFCGGKLFNPDSSFCFADSIVPLCSGKTYAADSNFCSSGLVVPQSKKAVWDLMNPEIEYGLFIDARDGQVYRSVKIGEQTWMAENLNYDYSRSYDEYHYMALSFCYNDSLEYCQKYGRLYKWSAAVDSAGRFGDAGKGCGGGIDSTVCKISQSAIVRGVCPKGWHLPDTSEFNTLVATIGGYDAASQKLKSKSGWNWIEEDDKDGNGTDDFGFSALPAGRHGYYGAFSSAGEITYFWSAVENPAKVEYLVINFAAYALALDTWEGEKTYLDNSASKLSSNSVRCVRD